MKRGLVAFLLASLIGSAPAAEARGRDSGTIEINVDASEAPRRLLHAHLVIPARPGPLTLFYPKWIQGEHQPAGPINDLAGLKLRAAGKPIPWQRDDYDLYAFHCTVPEGAELIEANLDYLIPGAKGGFGAGPAASARLAILNWYLVTLYPEGRPVRDIHIKASLKLPSGWQAGTALPVESKEGETIRFRTVTLEMFADSPALCGRYFRELPVGPAKGPAHSLVLACDSAEGLEISNELRENYGHLVEEAGALFGARHYRSYRFLVAMSELLSHNAIEHHECSDNRMPERMMIDPGQRRLAPAWVLAHEYVHSWNGKYRRPKGLATPDFQKPMATRLLWVYEGLTQYYGLVLAARSGLYAQDVSMENIGLVADWARNQKGRDWRPLEDTATAAPFLYTSRGEWAHRRRGVDFYDEGALLWLDVDTLIREKSKGAKSLDDFARNFYGGSDGPPEVKPYTFDDIVSGLHRVVDHDWKVFLEKRLNATDADPPLDGIARGGWKLVYNSERGELQKSIEGSGGLVDLSSSIGLQTRDDGGVIDVIPGTSCDRAGIGPHMRVLAVNGRRFTGDRLRDAVAATAGGKAKISLLVENGDYFQTFDLNYSDGARYVHLERDTTNPDRIGEIFAPRVRKKK